jgi:hypothetical protein
VRDLTDGTGPPFQERRGREEVVPMYPMQSPEMIRARVDELRRDAGRRRQAGRRAATPTPSWRLSLGLRLVSAGFRLLGEGVETR